MKRARERGTTIEKHVTAVHHSSVGTGTNSTTILDVEKAGTLLKVRCSNSGHPAASGIAQGTWAVVRRPDSTANRDISAANGNEVYQPEQEWILGGSISAIIDNAGNTTYHDTQEKIIEHWEATRRVKDGDAIQWKGKMRTGTMEMMAIVEVWVAY